MVENELREREGERNGGRGCICTQIIQGFDAPVSTLVLTE